MIMNNPNGVRMMYSRKMPIFRINQQPTPMENVNTGYQKGAGEERRVHWRGQRIIEWHI